MSDTPASPPQSTPQPTYSGSCYCKQVTFTATGPPSFLSLCQRLSGGTAVPWVGFPGQQLKITAGAQHLSPFKSSESMTRFFCSNCHSQVYGQSHIPGYEFRDAPLSIFNRDDQGTILDLDELSPVNQAHWPNRIKTLSSDNNSHLHSLPNTGLECCNPLIGVGVMSDSEGVGRVNEASDICGIRREFSLMLLGLVPES